MIYAFAPGMPRRGLWVWVAILGVGLTPLSVLAQKPGGAPAKDETPAKAAPAKGATPKAAPKAAAPKAEPAEEPEAPADDPLIHSTSVEIFKDPRAEKAIAIFKALPAPRPQITSSDLSTVKSMSAGLGVPNAELLQRYVQAYVAELTSPTNLRALITPGPKDNPRLARSLEYAVDALIEPVLAARANNQQGFLGEYNKILIEKLPPVLENNLLSRIDAMIVLGTTADRNDKKFYDLFLKQIADKDQVIWVKHWALRGITNLTQVGRADLPAQQSIQVGSTILSMLESEPQIPWPVVVRSLETIGANRLASVDPLLAQVPLAAYALKQANDPEARPEVRAWACWALGMVRIPNQTSKYNYGLVAYNIGRVAELLGDRIGAEYDLHKAAFDKSKDLATLYTSLLIYQVGGGLNGDPTIRESGILNVTHPNAGVSKKKVQDIDKVVKAVEKAAMELIRAGGTQQGERRADLAARVAELKAYLDKNPPEDTHLIPNGPNFPPAAPKVVRGQGGN